MVQLVAVGGLLCGTLMTTSAMAIEPSVRGGDGRAVPPAELGADLVYRLGTLRTAGAWIDSEGRPVVAVTDAAAAADVVRAGARAKVVRYSMRRLRSAAESLSKAPRVPGTAWAVDYAANKVQVQADSTVSGTDWW